MFLFVTIIMVPSYEICPGIKKIFCYFYFSFSKNHL